MTDPIVINDDDLPAGDHGFDWFLTFWALTTIGICFVVEAINMIVGLIHGHP